MILSFSSNGIWIKNILSLYSVHEQIQTQAGSEGAPAERGLVLLRPGQEGKNWDAEERISA